MKSILFALFILLLTSCVSQKKYKLLSSTSETQTATINDLMGKLNEEALAKQNFLGQIDLLKMMLHIQKTS